MKIISELLIDGKENFECACCHNIFYCNDAVMLKDNLNDEFFVCPNCYRKNFCSMKIEITRS